MILKIEIILKQQIERGGLRLNNKLWIKTKVKTNVKPSLKIKLFERFKLWISEIKESGAKNKERNNEIKEKMKVDRSK